MSIPSFTVFVTPTTATSEVIVTKDCAKGKHAKRKVCKVDPANRTYILSVIEGAPVDHKLHSGGSSVNLTCFHENNKPITDEELRTCKNKALELFDSLETYRRAHACTPPCGCDAS